MKKFITKSKGMFVAVLVLLIIAGGLISIKTNQVTTCVPYMYNSRYHVILGQLNEYKAASIDAKGATVDCAQPSTIKIDLYLI